MAHWKRKEIKKSSTLGQGLTSPTAVYNLIKTLQNSNEFYELEPAEVIDVLYEEKNLETNDAGDYIYAKMGWAKVRPIYSNHDSEVSELKWIPPLDTNIKEYPLIGEYVIIVTYIGQTFYSQKLNFLSSVNHNSYPGISATSKSSKEINPGKINFTSNENIRQVWPKEGDITFNGRFGQSIRFGKNEETLSPNIKISVGHGDSDALSSLYKPVIENINKDLSSIWILSDEKIDFTLGYNGTVSNFDGNEIILNSDRIVFNARKNELVGYSNSKIYFGSPNIQVNTKGTDEHLVLGETLISLIEELLDTLMKNQIATGGGPAVFNTGTSFNPAFVTSFKNKLKNILTQN